MKDERIKILNYQPDHQPFFEKLNRNWFEKHFHSDLEPVDKFILNDPEKAIIQRGGAIFLALYDNQLAGTLALKKIDPVTYEFSKMAVDQQYRRGGIGEALSRASIEKARLMGARRIILHSHSSLQAAIRLYSKLGFREIPLDDGIYSHFRCNMKMELELNTTTIIRADQSHAASIAAVGRRSFRDAFERFFNKDEDLAAYLDYTYNVEKISASIGKANNIFFVALDNDTIAGFAKIKKQSPNKQITANNQMELQKIYMLKEHQGKGLADALLRHVLAEAEKIKSDCIWLDVLTSNKRAARFYEKSGFEKKGSRLFKIGTQIFTYDIMVLPLQPVAPSPFRFQMINHGND